MEMLRSKLPSQDSEDQLIDSRSDRVILSRGPIHMQREPRDELGQPVRILLSFDSYPDKQHIRRPGHTSLEVSDEGGLEIIDRPRAEDLVQPPVTKTERLRRTVGLGWRPPKTEILTEGEFGRRLASKARSYAQDKQISLGLADEDWSNPEKVLNALRVFPARVSKFKVNAHPVEQRSHTPSTPRSVPPPRR